MNFNGDYTLEKHVSLCVSVSFVERNTGNTCKANPNGGQHSNGIGKIKKINKNDGNTIQTDRKDRLKTAIVVAVALMPKNERKMDYKVKQLVIYVLWVHLYVNE